jgi:hypothetical protein
LAHVLYPDTRDGVGWHARQPEQQAEEPKAAVGRSVFDDKGKSPEERFRDMITGHDPAPGFEDPVRSVESEIGHRRRRRLHAQGVARSLVVQADARPSNLTGAANKKPAYPDLHFVDNGVAGARLVPDSRPLRARLLDPLLQRDQAPLK